MKQIDDYDLMDLDPEEFLRRGREAFGITEEDTNETIRENDGR